MQKKPVSIEGTQPGLEKETPKADTPSHGHLWTTYTFIITTEPHLATPDRGGLILFRFY